MTSISSPEDWITDLKSQNQFSYKDATQEEVLEELSSRFILNLPDEELNSLDRICFQVEQAHWFYEDFIREENTRLPSMALKRFSEMLFHSCPLLTQWSHEHEEKFKEFMQYKSRVPVCGAIMLNNAMDKVVLVKGWKASSNWGFPKGKINETEPTHACAIREVLEETGYNLAGQLEPADVIELSIKEQKISLFIVPGVPEDFNFQTRTRKEISQIAWFNLSELPTWKRNKGQISNKKFYLISPFIGPLKAFINERRPRNGRKPPKPKKGAQSQSPPAASGASNGSIQTNYDHVNTHSNGTTSTGTTASFSQDSLGPELSRLFSALLPNTAAASTIVSREIDAPDCESSTEDCATHSQSDASLDSPIISRPPEETDMPSPVPVMTNAQSSLATQQPSASTTALKTPLLRPQLSPSTSSPPHLRGNGPTSPGLSSLPRSVLTPQPRAAPTSPTRGSSTADISSYLSSKTETMISPKTLSHLQLLQSVAEESARMAPRLAAESAQANRSPVNGYMPPLSVPPVLFQHDSREPAPMHPGLISTAAGFHPRPPMDSFLHSMSDPFQVRARTSQAFHRPPVHNSTGSVSVNQNHLLSVINSARNGPLPNAPYPTYTLQQHTGPFALPPNPPYHLPPQNTAPFLPPTSGLQPYAPHPILPSQFAGFPTMNTLPRGADVVQHVPHNPLLSLLNARPASNAIPPTQAHQ